MIRIEERACEKLSGLSSFFISFNYNEFIISWIKQNIDLYNYNKKTKEWEICVNSLASTLDSLSVFDSIELKLLDDKKQMREQKKISLNYKLKPFKHQEEAINFGLNHDKWLLLDDMGLGKTASIIHIAEELKAQENLKHCLIICAINTLKANWKKEIKLHSNETFRVLGEKISKNGNISYSSVKERAEELLKPIDEFFIITNIETLRSDDVIEALKINKNDIQMIVCDEVHKAANKGSIQGNNFLKLQAKYKIAATGTLLTNAPVNAYVPLKWIDVDKSTLTNFKREYCIFGGFGGHEIVGYKNIDILKEEIDNCSLRRTKEDVLKNLPKKTIIKEYVTMSDEHRKFYNNVKKGVKEECNKIVLNQNNILALVTRLRQATACPQILTTNNIISSKLERIVDLVEELILSKEKVVIFSTYKESVYELAKMLNMYNPIICTGDDKDQYIADSIEIFQKNPEKKILIATHQKLGTGVTLTAASYMIFIDTPFTAAAFNQACDRIYRIGTEKPVFIYNIICEDSIDERVADIIERKEAISNYIIDDKVDNNSLDILKDYILDL